MKSTWRENREAWTSLHAVASVVDPFHFDPLVPVFAKTDPVPVGSQSSMHLWIISHAIWPMILQSSFVYTTGYKLDGPGAFALYVFATTVNAIHEGHMLKKVAYQTGYFDGDEHKRDEMPDAGIRKALLSVVLTFTVRPLYTIFFSYQSERSVSLSAWLPVELGLYAIVLDFWFYLYHRACHEVGFLWKYHRTHHLTKHPNPLLSAYADSEQEIIEIVLVPLLTYASLKILGLPMGFYDWWICQQYIIFTEGSGHSGLRIWATPPGTASPILWLFGCELVIEDHDLHHRRGWRKSTNYGKQTRLWDRVFGTCADRIESHHGNVDFSQHVHFPLW